MNLVIEEEVYKIKVGAEVYTVDIPSLEQSDAIKTQASELNTDEEAEDFIKKWLIKLGLEEKFMTLKLVKKSHLFKIWSEINTIKK